MKHLVVIIFSLVLSSNAVAFEVKSNTFVGHKTKIAQPITVVLPDNYSTNKRYNVIYVLHGFSGN
ncbi:MAG: esterase family protein, partial [Pseudoalteromonas nigrifaciens]